MRKNPMNYVLLYIQFVLLIIVVQMLRHKTLTEDIRKFYRESIEINTLDRMAVDHATPAILFLTMLAYAVIPVLNCFIVLSLITGQYNRVVGSAVIHAALSDKAWRAKPKG